MPINRKSLCLCLGYPITSKGDSKSEETSEGNKPKRLPLETRAKILLEIMKGPISRVKLKERFNDVSTKTVDFHVQRADNSLLKLRIIKEKNNVLTVNLRDPESLVEICNILQADKEKGPVISKAIDSAFVKCFVDGFGDHAGSIKGERGKDSDAIGSYLENRRLTDDIINTILGLAAKTYQKIDLGFKVHYIIKVMGNVREAQECYLVNSSKNYRYLDSSSADEGLKRVYRKPGTRRCQLWDFTNSILSSEYVEFMASAVTDLFPELLQNFYNKIILEPLSKGETSFKVIDEEIVKDLDTWSALIYTDIFLAMVGGDHYRDNVYDPFESGMILRVVEKVKTSKREGENIQERIFKLKGPLMEEYIEWRLERSKANINQMKAELVNVSQVPGKSKTYI